MISQKKGLVILGAGGHGRVVADAAEASGQWDDIAFLDDRFPELALMEPWPIVGTIDDAGKIRQRFSDAAVGIGSNEIRLKMLNDLRDLGFNLPIIVHPTAAISPHTQIECGTVIFAQAVINIGSVIGMGCIVNTGAKIDHDCILGSGVHISPGANLAGAVRVGECSWVGMGASIKQGITIGGQVIIGLGAAVINNVQSEVTAVGIPARVVTKT